LLEAIEDMPMDMEIALHYAGASFQLLRKAKIIKLWINGEETDVISLFGNCKFYSYP
jgi:hypothetical protein